MTRGSKVRRGVVMLSLVVAGAAGCAGGRPAVEPAAHAAPPASRPTAAPGAGRPAAAPTRTTEVVNFPVGSWRRLPPSPPVRLEIPAIGVSSPLVRLGFNPDGTMQVPGDFQVAGWFTGGPQPGQLGPAVIAGHVDSRTGPAVFHRLRDLRPGDQIRVVRADRLVVRFRVESLASYPKRWLPDEAVYGATTAPALRLITCAGTFDRARHSYRDNLVVSAVRVADGHGRGEAGR
jgi:sortase (surface protein transpeptidase)